MSEPTSETMQMAAEAAETLIGYYPTIQASDPKIYATGLVQIFSRYPEHLVAAAIDPGNGLPSLYDYPPTMKQAKEFLEPRWREMELTRERMERANRKRLAEPPRDPERDKRIFEGLQQLKIQIKNGGNPSTQ